jgi:hypothetical protein
MEVIAAIGDRRPAVHYVNSILQYPDRGSVQETTESAKRQTLELGDSEQKGRSKHRKVNSQKLADLSTSHASIRARSDLASIHVPFIDRIVPSVKEI